MSDWFTYKWPLHERIATFRVDRSCAAKLDPMEDAGVLIHVSCQPMDPNADSFSFWERRRLSSLPARCMDILGAEGVYAGSIELGTQIRYYFYAPDAKQLVPIYELCAAERRLNAVCAKADEPKKQTYYRLLLPDAAKLQSVVNAEYIRRFQKRGDDGSAHRRIELHFAFHAAAEADAFLSAALADGFALGPSGFSPERALPHETRLYAVSTLNWAALTDLTTRSIRLAEANGGEFVSMEAAFVERKK